MTRDPAAPTRWLAVGLIAGVLALGGWHRLHPRPPAPQPRDPRTAEPWMLDALPGIGAKRRDAAAAAVRAGAWDQLPQATRTAATEAFTGVPGTRPEREP